MASTGGVMFVEEVVGLVFFCKWRERKTPRREYLFSDLTCKGISMARERRPFYVCPGHQMIAGLSRWRGLGGLACFSFFLFRIEGVGSLSAFASRAERTTGRPTACISCFCQVYLRIPEMVEWAFCSVYR